MSADISIMYNALFVLVLQHMYNKVRLVSDETLNFLTNMDSFNFVGIHFCGLRKLVYLWIFNFAVWANSAYIPVKKM